MSKIIIYSVLPRLWGNTHSMPVPHGSIAENGSGKLSAWDEQALSYVRDLGCTHIWFIGLLDHATTTSYNGITADPEEIVKGKAGSPYAIRDYYDVAPELADNISERHQELESLIQRIHQAGLKILMDFVPNHVARSYHTDSAPFGTLSLGDGDDPTLHFATTNCFYYFPDQELALPRSGVYREYPAKATGNDCFSTTPSANDWYETIKLNYGIDYLAGGVLHTSPQPVLWSRMYEILNFWAAKGIDGFRCDMAEMVPEAFWAWVISKLRGQYPTLLFLAEIYQPHRYENYLSAGFDSLYDKVGIYDTMRGIITGEQSANNFDPVRDATGHRQQAMCYFLENHDEQRLPSAFFASSIEPIYAALPALILSGNNPYLHYFAGELGEAGMEAEGFSGLDGRTTIFDYWALPCLGRLSADYSGNALLPYEQDLLAYHRKIFRLCNSLSTLCLGQYHGLNYLQKATEYNGHRILSFVRYHEGEVVLVVCNFSNQVESVSLRFTSELITQIGLTPNTPLQAVDLLSGQQSVTTLSTWASFDLSLSPYRASIMSLKTIER